MPFAQLSLLGLLFIAPKPLVSAISRKGNANFEFNFDHKGQEASTLH
jgi:hypothetical protein